MCRSGGIRGHHWGHHCVHYFTSTFKAHQSPWLDMVLLYRLPRILYCPQVYRGADADGSLGDIAAEVGGRRHHAATHCTARAMAGIPPTHHLWEVGVCFVELVCQAGEV